jgi:hypothetical protein
MKKMKTVFVIDRENGSVATPEVVSDSAWVLNGEGVATIKRDGTSSRVKDGKLFKRMDRKLTKAFGFEFRRNPGLVLEDYMFKGAHEDWEACEPAPDKKTGHWPGWLPVDPGDPANEWHIEAFSAAESLEDGTYELVGPKIQNNKYGLDRHVLMKHGEEVVDVDRSFEGLKAWLEANEVEGLVFHHPDGRMAKLRRKDFGIAWA